MLNHPITQLEGATPRLLGAGAGCRGPHIPDILQDNPAIGWFELLADNHMTSGGWPRHQALAISERYPVALHCVGMSIGSVDPLNQDYLKALARFAEETNPVVISDHLCWTSLGGQYSHELLPLPLTEEALWHVVHRIKQVQDTLGRAIALENVSTYARFKGDEFSDAAFLNAVAEEADCQIILDLTNLRVNEVNHGIDARQALGAIEVERIAYVHVAGYDAKAGHLLDAHNGPVPRDVWDLLDTLVQRRPALPVLVEWDRDLPPLETLVAEVQGAQDILNKAAHLKMGNLKDVRGPSK